MNEEMPNSILKIIYRLKLLDIIFYVMAFFLTLFNKITEKNTMKDIFNLFYIQFLKIPKENCEIVQITDNKLITRCNNKCFILELSIKLGIDTKISCKRISEGPSKFFLKRLNKNLIFKRNYNHIRPTAPSCEETILFLK